MRRLARRFESLRLATKICVFSVWGVWSVSNSLSTLSNSAGRVLVGLSSLLEVRGRPASICKSYGRRYWKRWPLRYLIHVRSLALPSLGYVACSNHLVLLLHALQLVQLVLHGYCQLLTLLRQVRVALNLRAVCLLLLKLGRWSLFGQGSLVKAANLKTGGQGQVSWLRQGWR